MALSQFIIDFNSAMCHAGGENEAFMMRQRRGQQDVAGVQEDERSSRPQNICSQAETKHYVTSAFPL